jgi:hypothetical protein
MGRIGKQRKGGTGRNNHEQIIPKNVYFGKKKASIQSSPTDYSSSAVKSSLAEMTNNSPVEMTNGTDSVVHQPQSYTC